MKTTSIILFFSLTFTIHASGVIWNTETLCKQAKESQSFFKGKIKSFTQKFYLENRVTKKKTQTTKKDAIKLYKSYLDGTIPFKTIEELPSVKFITKAIIEVEEKIRGTYKKGDIINFEWEDLYDSMCPHATTSALDQKIYIWFERYGHTKDKANLSVIPAKKEKALLEAFKINQKKKEEQQRKHKIKVKDLLQTLEKPKDEDQLFDSLFELSESNDVIIEETLIKHLANFKGNQDVLEVYIDSLGTILARKKKTELTSLKLSQKIKDKLKKEIERQIEPEDGE